MSRARTASTTFFATTPAHSPNAERFLPRAGAVKDALLQRRRRLVLDGSEHGRTMIDSGGPGDPGRRAARTRTFAAPWSSEKRRRISRHMHADGRGNDRNPKGRDPPRGARSRGPFGPRDRAWPDRREGAAQILRIWLFKHVRLTDGGRCRAQGSLRGRIARLSDGLSRVIDAHIQKRTTADLRSATARSPPITSVHWGIASMRPDVDLLRDLHRVVDLDAQIANGTFDLECPSRWTCLLHRVAAGCNVIDAHCNQIATAQLAVDRQVSGRV